jgi:hypothetical protein
MTGSPLPDDILAKLRAIQSKRPRTVIEHIIEHGYITTEELTRLYGYTHPPRAARDVREQGIPLETFNVTDSTGRTIAAYRFGDLSQIAGGRLGGRRSFSRAFKEELIRAQGARCAICLTPYAPRYLQIDHRVPYEVLGDTDAERDPNDYMLLCGSCNRAKSWSCEHCVNWLEIKNPTICLSCYWANAASYKHIALREIRRADIVWTEGEVATFDLLKARADAQNEPLPEYVKAIIQEHLKETES